MSQGIGARQAARGLAPVAAAVMLFAVTASAAPQAPVDRNGFVGQVQVFDADRTGLRAPAGLAFSRRSDAFYATERPGRGPAQGETEVVKLTPFRYAPGSDRAAQARIGAAVGDPINLTFDSRYERLLLLDQAGRLLEVRVDATGELDPRTLVRREALRLSLADPQGMTVDPATGTIFILDVAQPRLLKIEPGRDGSLDQAQVSEVDLGPLALLGLRGLALDPVTGHLHLGSEQRLYELDRTGELEAVRNLADLSLASPQGMSFAPSGDQTDDPSRQSLYLADAGGGVRSSSGQIVELSLEAPPAIESTDFTASLVRTIDTGDPPGTFQPPSPDPSGLTYLPPPRNTLLMVDGEVEETVSGITHFEGVNVWEMTLLGSVVDTANISRVEPTDVPMTNEPVGVTWNPNDGHYFVSEDGNKRIYNLNPNGDGVLGTVDDGWNYFVTNDDPGETNVDPEGIAYDTAANRLFVADGVNAEIYQWTTSGTLVGQFDVLGYGVADPETVEYNPDSDTLFVLSNHPSGPIIVEVTKTGELLRTIDVSGASDHKPAGLAWAPASDDSGVKHFYWADRGIDNNADPEAVDGKIYEFTAPPVAVNDPPAITSDGGGPTASKSVAENQTSVTDVDASDPNAGDTVSYSISGGADQAAFAIAPTSGVLTFINAPDHESPSDQGANNVYEVRVRATDGSLFDEQQLSVTVLNVNEFGPVITSDGGDATANLAAAENQTSVTDVNALDGDFEVLAYSVSGGADAARFQIVGTSGVLTFVAPPDFESPSDADLNGVYEVIVQVSDGSLTDTQALFVTVTDTNENSPPAITSDGGGPTASKSVAENQASVTDVDATDPNAGDTVTYSISGGADAARFQIVGTSGVLTFVVAPDFESPSDANLNGVYEVIVQASDGTLTDTQALSVTVTDVNENAAALYFSLRDPATLPGGLSVANEDIVFFNGTSTFSIYFDGSDVGIGTLRIDAFTRVDPDTILLSFDADKTVAALGAVDDSDIFRFDGVLGPATSGTFSLYFDGSDVGLTATGQDVDAVELLANGHLLVSIVGSATVSGVTVRDEDLVEFTPTSTGADTAGSFSMYFDGSDVGLTDASEDVDAFALDGSGKLYFSTFDAFAVTGVSGADEDVFVFTPSSLGSKTAGSFSPNLFFDGSLFGLGANDVFAIDLP